MAEWFVQSKGKAYGPFDSATLVKLARVGKVKPNDLVKKGRKGKWKRARQVRRLFDTNTLASQSDHEQITAGDPRPDIPLGDDGACELELESSFDPVDDESQEYEIAAEPIAVDRVSGPAYLNSAHADSGRPAGILSERNLAVTLARASWRTPLIASLILLPGVCVLGPAIAYALWCVSAVLGMICGVMAMVCFCVGRHREVVTPALAGIIGSGMILGFFFYVLTLL